MIGHTQYCTAPFYRAEGYDAIVKFAEPLTDQKIDGLNDAGHWINQGFVVRLAALLQSCQIIGTKGSGIQLIPGLDGYEEVSILRELRNAFAHSSGKYDSTDSDKRKLYNRVIKHFSLDPKQYPEDDGKFPIPIDKVLVPLAEGCKKYVRAVHQQGILRDTPLPRRIPNETD